MNKLNRPCLILVLCYAFFTSFSIFSIQKNNVSTKEKSVSKKILFILMPNYRDEEFYVPFDILKKAGHKIDVAGFEKGITTGAGGYKYTVNIVFKSLTDTDFDKYDALVIPGGPGSTTYLWNNKEKLHDIIRYFHNHGKIVAAICYACIAVVQSGILKGKDATVYPTEEAIKILKKEVDFVYYGGKHYESLYTRFLQAYILPKKFNFDKRRAHLSSLICSSQMTRKEAMEEIQNNPYPTKEMMLQDRIHVLKKLGLTEGEFEKIMFLPIKTVRDYSSNYRLFLIMRKLSKKIMIFRFI